MITLIYFKLTFKTKEFTMKKTINIIEKLIIDNLNFAELLAAKFKKNKKYSYEELKSAAYMGLVEAATKYDSLKNNSFKAFAFLRINGAMKDYIREIKWGTRRNPLKMLSLQEGEF